MSGRLIEEAEIRGDPLKYGGLGNGIVTSTSRHGDKITMLTILTQEGEWNVAVREISQVNRGIPSRSETEKTYARKLIDALRTSGRMINHHLARAPEGDPYAKG